MKNMHGVIDIRSGGMEIPYPILNVLMTVGPISQSVNILKKNYAK